MGGWKLGLGAVLVAVGLVFLFGTRWAMRRGTRPVQQVALLGPLAVGTAALIGGAMLLMTTSVTG